MVAMARLNGQAIGAALVALCFGLAGARGPVWALGLGAALAGGGGAGQPGPAEGGRRGLSSPRPSPLESPLPRIAGVA